MLPRVNLIRTDGVDYLLFSTSDTISSTIYSTGAWANLLVDIGAVFCSDVERPFVLDVGANLGAYSIPLAKRLVADALIYAFEPQRIIYYQLCGNIFLNRLENVHAFNTAVGDEIGHIALQTIDYHKSINIGSASVKHLSDDTRNAVIGVTGMTEVAITTLDGLALPRSPTLIKIDVEGFELEVLKGAHRMLRDAGYPPMLLEAWSDPTQAAEMQVLMNEIEGLGYTTFQMMDEIIAQHPSHPRQFTFHISEQTGVSMARTR